MEELRECPFCQSRDWYGNHRISKLTHKEGCYLKHSTLLNHETRPEETTAWNTRATDPLLEKMARAATHLLANPEGVEEWHELAGVLREYRERKDATTSN